MDQDSALQTDCSLQSRRVRQRHGPPCLQGCTPHSASQDARRIANSTMSRIPPGLCQRHGSGTKVPSACTKHVDACANCPATTLDPKRSKRHQIFQRRPRLFRHCRLQNWSGQRVQVPSFFLHRSRCTLTSSCCNTICNNYIQRASRTPRNQPENMERCYLQLSLHCSD